MHSWQRGGMILTMMTTETTTTKTTTTTTVNEDNDKYTIGEENDDLIFDTTTNLWSDAFLAGRVGDLDNDDNGNYNQKEEG